MFLPNLRKLFFVAVCILALSSAAIGETNCNGLSGKLPDVCKQTNFPVGSFNVTVSYNSESAYAGNDYVDLNISIQSRDSSSLEIVTCESSEEPKIKCKRESGPALTTEKDLSVAQYTYRVAIAPGVEPKPYPLVLTFRHDKKEERNEVRLFVGVTNNLKVRVETDLTEPPNVFTGVSNQLQLTIVNDYTNYPVNLHSVSVKSDPYGLIQDETIPLNVKIEPGGQSQSVTVPFSAAAMTFSSLISGFNTPRVIMTLKYDDGYGRTVSKPQSVEVRIRPRDRVLVFYMLMGVLLGSLIKLVLQRKQESGQISSRQVITFVSITMTIGLVVALIAMVGRIQIVAFDAKGSYDKPLVIFAIALVGALGGAQILSMWLNKSVNGSSGPKLQPGDGPQLPGKETS
jgi:hypothetical protein